MMAAAVFSTLAEVVGEDCQILAAMIRAYACSLESSATQARWRGAFVIVPFYLRLRQPTL